MKVKELVEALLEQDQELVVGYHDVEYGFCEIEKPLWVKTVPGNQQEVLVL